MGGFKSGLAQWLAGLMALIRTLPALGTGLGAVFRGLRRAIMCGFRRPERGGCCLELPPGVFGRPDPLIYDQYYLMAQGLAVTWDNPDFQLFDMGGNPVTPDGLAAGTDYRVRVRAWNNSYTAPAPDLPVYLSFLTFGVSTTSTPVGSAKTDLGAKGSPHCPAFAEFTWKTPSTPGHYCLQALLAWPDDANPNNNLGQMNTQVIKAHSPAVISFPVRNGAAVARRYELEVDMYAIPGQPPCSDQPPPPRRGGRLAESRARWDRALAAQGYGRFPVTPAWNVSITPAAFGLDAGAEITVTVSIEPASGSFVGTQPFNVHAFATPPTGVRAMAGGVTLYFQGT